jgi:hypothetical protein
MSYSSHCFTDSQRYCDARRNSLSSIDNTHRDLTRDLQIREHSPAVCGRLQRVGDAARQALHCPTATRTAEVPETVPHTFSWFVCCTTTPVRAELHSPSDSGAISLAIDLCRPYRELPKSRNRSPPFTPSSARTCSRCRAQYGWRPDAPDRVRSCGAAG